MNAPGSFRTVIYSYHGPDGAQQAARSLDADGGVEGSHISWGGTAPLVSISSERARVKDVHEIAGIVDRLPGESSSIDSSRSGYLQLEVVMGDGSRRTYRATEARGFSDPMVRRLLEIMRSYQAGYW